LKLYIRGFIKNRRLLANIIYIGTDDC